jgi:hypothetical protein
LKTSHWYLSSMRAIDAAMRDVPANASLRDVERVVKQAYPFGPRQHHPYKQWCKAQRDFLSKRFPTQYVSKVPVPATPLFGGVA